MIAKKNLWLACRAAVVVAAGMASLCASADVVINETNFPDAKFRAYVSRLPGSEDGVFTPEELAAITEVNCPDKSIASLKGIEHFKLLQNLICYKNQLTSLDVSQNTALKELNCYHNQLTRLDVSQNTALTELKCYENQLTSLDVSHNTALTTLKCDENQLTSLDVSQNTALTELLCYSNQLTSLDVSHNTALTKLECWKNQLTSLDVSHNTALKELNCYHNQLTSLDVSQNTALTDFNCVNNQLTSLDLSQNTALTWIYCNDNQLTSLNLGQNTVLKELWCHSNQLTSLDVSQNTALKTLSCRDNQLTSLDVSNNKALASLNANNCARTVPMYYYMENGNKVAVMPVGNVASNPLYADGFRLEKASNWTNATVTEGGLLVVADTTRAVTYTYNTGLAGKDVTFTLKKSAQDGGEFVLINEENFPDANFRAYVSTLPGGGDGMFTPEELAAITEVDCTYKSIASLKGVEHFKLLQILSCYYNQLTSIDLSQNTALKRLNFSYNQLKSLDVSQNKALTYLSCSSNQLKSLDVSQNTALNVLSCFSNQLTSLDVSQNTALTELYCSSNQLKSLDVSQDTALKYLECYNNQLTNLDVSHNKLLAELKCYSNQLTSLDVSQNTALDNLSCYSNQLKSLDVSQNTALKSLDCHNNQLTSLDVSNNKALASLNANDCARTVPMCYYMENGNKVTLMPVDNDASNPLYADGFRLEKASNWTNAEMRTIDGNQVLVVTDTTQAVTYTYNTGLTGKNVTFTLKKSAQDGGEFVLINEENFPDANFRAYVSTLQGGGDGIFTPEELAAITKVDCPDKSIASLKGVEHFKLLQNLRCFGNQLTSLDVSQNTALTYLICSANQLTSLDLSHNTALTYLSCSSNQLTSLDLSHNTALTSLYCYSNQLTSLDVSHNKALGYLECHHNQLTSLDVNGCTALQILYCNGNQLTSLDVSGCTALTKLYCQRNQLTSLDVSNNKALVSLHAEDCARTVPMCYYMENGNKVTLMPVDNDASNPLYADGFRLEKASNWTNAEMRTIDGKQVLVVTDTTQAVTYTYNTGLAGKNVTFTLKKSAQDGGEFVLINEENFPDATFRAYVSTLPGGGDGIFTPEELAAITEVYCPYKSIASLKGVEHFKLLQNLSCFGNQLTSLDLSQNTALTYLQCTYNELTSLDLSQNTALTYLECHYNELTSLDLSQNTALTYLECHYNELTSLDLSQNTALTYLQCTYNELTSLDLSQNTALTYLECHYNELTSLDLSQNTALTELYCSDNQLTSLDVSQNTALTRLTCNRNQLTSLDVSQNTALKQLYCVKNQLTSLDLSNNKALVYLDVDDCGRTLPMYYYMENGNKVTVMPVGNDASNPLYADGFRLEKASNWTNAEVRTIDGKQVLVVTDATQPVTYSYDTGNQRFLVSFTIRWGVDVNGDGNVDTADVSTLINVVLGNIEGDSDVCDVNGDGVVDALDVSTLIGMICGYSN